jgi:2-methylcitrate dehydratase PrpD
MFPTETIANFIARTKTQDIPERVFALAKRSLIDTFGVALGATQSGVDGALRKLAQTTQPGDAFLWNGQGRAAATDAAWMNGALAHALDFDDGGVALTPMHPSSPVLPAVWALGERNNRSGRELLAAYVLGLEVECKLAGAVSLTHYDHGWHATGTIGSFGAVAGAGWLLRLDAEQMRSAIGITASMASGLKSNFGTMTKPLHAGLAARNGVMAAQLSQAGWSANPYALDAKKGFLDVYGCGEIGELTLGQPYHFESPGVSLKRFPSCSATHHCIEAMFALTRSHDLRAEQVDAIECRVHALSYQALRKEPEAASAEAARFSLHFTMALVLLEGAVELKHFLPETRNRTDVRALMAKVRVAVHPELETLESKQKVFGEVQVRLKDGRLLTQRATQVRGRAPLTLTDADVDAKFLGCAEPALGAAKAQELLAKLRRLDEQPEIRSLLPAAFGLA